MVVTNFIGRLSFHTQWYGFVRYDFVWLQLLKQFPELFILFLIVSLSGIVCFKQMNC